MRAGLKASSKNCTAPQPLVKNEALCLNPAIQVRHSAVHQWFTPDQKGFSSCTSLDVLHENNRGAMVL